MAKILQDLGFTVELLTVNFGVYPSYHPAAESAKNLGFTHRRYNMEKDILLEGVSQILKDDFPNNGINIIHHEVIEKISQEYDVVADGTRRDDRIPKLTRDEIRSLEDRHKVQYINLDSFGYKTIQSLSSQLFEIHKEKSNKENSSDYEVEIRELINELSGPEKTLSIFPEHYQTRVIGWKK